MEDYQIRLRRHLSEYKLLRLGISEEGIWRRNGKRYPHILPESHRVENLLETYRADLDAHIEGTSTLERHRDFHHLNSSQAMCLNLFYPFFAAPEADSLAPAFFEAIGLTTDGIEQWHFEYVEDEREGTNFDFFTLDRTGVRTYVEVKLSESEFGTAKADDRHKQKRREIYQPRLHGHVSSEVLTSDVFFANYQILRNLAYAAGSDSSRVLFLYPRANTALGKLPTFLESHVGDELRSRVAIVHLEDLIPALAAKVGDRSDRLREHLALFSEKYLLPEV